MSTIGQELRKCRNHLRMTLPEMAAKLNVSTTTIVNYETGKRLPDIDFLIDFAGVCERDFLYWLGLRIAASNAALAAPASALLDTARGSPIIQSGQSFVSLPLYNINDVATPAPESRHMHIADEIPQFSTAWLERELNATPADLCLVPVEDDSMMTSLRPGDIILLDRRSTKADREGIYMLRMNGVSLIKRLQILPGEIIKVVSDNPAYETFTIRLSDINNHELAILGRAVWVVWAGRRI